MIQKQKELAEKLEVITKVEKEIMELRSLMIKTGFFKEILRSVMNGKQLTEEQKKILEKLIKK